jgi:hypothetical protein
METSRRLHVKPVCLGSRTNAYAADARGAPTTHNFVESASTNFDLEARKRQFEAVTAATVLLLGHRLVICAPNASPRIDTAYQLCVADS